MSAEVSQKPLVSVYIPTKDRRDMLSRAIDSVFAQTYPNVEIVVSDDGSTDSTREFMEDLCQRYSNVVYLREEASKGACFARNKAIRAASGVFVTGLDDDDEFEPNRIELFQRNWSDDCSFLCSMYKVFDGKRYIHSLYLNRKITVSQQFRRNYVGTQIFVKRSSLIDNDLFFDERFPAWQDYDFFTHLLQALGPAKRVRSWSYIQYIDHEKGRVTNKMRILRGYLLYLGKYCSSMSRSQRISLAVNAYVLRSKPAGRKLFKMCMASGNYWDVVRLVKKFYI